MAFVIGKNQALGLPNLGIICQQAAAAPSQDAPVAAAEAAAATLPIEGAPPMQEPALAVTARQSAERASHALVPNRLQW